MAICKTDVFPKLVTFADIMAKYGPLPRHPDLGYRPTWSELCNLDSQLKDLMKEAKSARKTFRDTDTDEGYGDVLDYWYGRGNRNGLKHRMCAVVGWERDDPILGAREAYDVAYERLFCALSGEKPSHVWGDISKVRSQLTPRKRFAILERDGFRCRYCGVQAEHLRPGSRLVVDHVIPVSRGGTNSPDNLVCACHDCNAGKAAIKIPAIMDAKTQEA